MDEPPRLTRTDVFPPRFVGLVQSRASGRIVNLMRPILDRVTPRPARDGILAGPCVASAPTSHRRPHKRAVNAFLSIRKLWSAVFAPIFSCRDLVMRELMIGGKSWCQRGTLERHVAVVSS